MAYCRQCGNVTIAQNRDGTCSDCAMDKLLNKELAERDASLGVGHIWTNVQCPAYASYDPSECVCRAS